MKKKKFFPNLCLLRVLAVFLPSIVLWFKGISPNRVLNLYGDWSVCKSVRQHRYLSLESCTRVLWGGGESSRSTEKEERKVEDRGACSVGHVVSTFDRIVPAPWPDKPDVNLVNFWPDDPDKQPRLSVLHTRFQNVLPTSIASRATPHLTHEELTKLMKWKLTASTVAYRNKSLSCQ